MKLRFRGACWEEISTPAAPTRTATIGTNNCCGRKESIPNISTSLRDLLLLCEGLELPSQHILLRRPQPVKDLSAWSGENVRGTKSPREMDEHGPCEGLIPASRFGLPMGAAGIEPVIEPSWKKSGDGIRHHQRTFMQPLPIAPACCVITSEPTTELVPELSFPKVMLTSRSRRAALFLLTQDVIPAIPECCSSVASQFKGRGWCALPTSIDDNRTSLLELFEPKTEVEAIHESKGWGSSSSTPATATTKGTEEQHHPQHQRFGSIPLDLDEETWSQYQKILPSEGDSDKPRRGVCESVQAAGCLAFGIESTKSPNNAKEDTAPSPLSSPIWRVLGLGPLLKPWQLTNGRRSATSGWASSPLQSSVDLQPMRTALSTNGRLRIVNKPTFRDKEKIRVAESGVASVLSLRAHQPSHDLTDVSGGSVGCFTRIDMDGIGQDEDDLGLRETPLKPMGLFGLLGTLSLETELHERDTTRFSPLACVDSRRGFDPHDSGVRSAIFPPRSRAIPMGTVGKRERGRRQHHDSFGIKLHDSIPEWRWGIVGENSTGRRRTYRGLLTPLWAAIRKVVLVEQSLASSQPLLWKLASRRQLVGHAWQPEGTLETSISSILSSEPTSCLFTSVTERADILLVELLESWRKMHTLSPPAIIKAKAQRAHQQDCQTPTRSSATVHSPYQQATPPMTALSSQRSSNHTAHQAQKDHTIDVLKEAQRAQEAPAYEDIQKGRGTPKPCRPAGVSQGGKKSSSTNRDDGASMGIQQDGETYCRSKLMSAKEGVSAEAAPAVGQGSLESTPSKKSPQRSKRKLGGALWTFGAAGARNGHVQGRAMPSPNSTTIGSRTSSSRYPTKRVPSSAEVDRVVPSSRIESGAFWPSAHGGGENNTTDPFLQRRHEDGSGSDADETLASTAGGSRKRQQTLQSPIDGRGNEARSSLAPRPSGHHPPATSTPSPKPPLSVGGFHRGPSSPNTATPRERLLGNPFGESNSHPERRGARHEAASQSTVGATTSKTTSRKPASEPSAHENAPIPARKTEDISLIDSAVSKTGVGHAERRGSNEAGMPMDTGQCTSPVHGLVVAQDEQQDAAMAECRTGRQREILASIRAGAMGETFLLSRGRRATSSDSQGKQWKLKSVAPGNKAPRRYSGAWTSMGLDDFSSVSLPVGLHPSAGSRQTLKHYTRDVSDRVKASRVVAAPIITHGIKVRRKTAGPLYAIVSEDFVSKAGSMVLRLSAPILDSPTFPHAAQPATMLQRMTPEVVPPFPYDIGATVAQRRGRFRLLELPVGEPVDLVLGSRSAVVVLDSRVGRAVEPVPSASTTECEREDHNSMGDTEEQEEATETAKAKEKLRLLQLQTLKYSSIWILIQMDKAHLVATGARKGITRLRPALEKLEQWLVGFPCRVLIRYSYSEAHLAELITHAAATEQREGRRSGTRNKTGSAGISVPGAGEKRRRTENGTPPGGEVPIESTSKNVAAGRRSPLEAVVDCSKDDPDWAAWHHRQVWFLQLFPTLNAFSASALLSSASLKHLIVAPYEELAPTLLGKGAGVRGDGRAAEGNKSSTGGAARGGVTAERLRDFCAAVRAQEGEISGES